MPAALIDTTTLITFASIDRLELLAAVVAGRQPHWTEGVYGEVLQGAHLPVNQLILAATWLGEPAQSQTSELAAITRLHIGLNDGRRPPTDHHGEAETIVIAHRLEATWITDDGPAAAFAKNNQLAPLRTTADTGTVLQEAQLERLLASPHAALAVVTAMVHAGRHPRCGGHMGASITLADLVP